MSGGRPMREPRKVQPAVLTFNFQPSRDCREERTVSYIVTHGKNIRMDSQPQATFRPHMFWAWGHGELMISSLKIGTMEQLVQPISSEMLMSPPLHWFEAELAKAWAATKHGDWPLTIFPARPPSDEVPILALATITLGMRAALTVSGRFVGAALYGVTLEVPPTAPIHA